MKNLTKKIAVLLFTVSAFIVVMNFNSCSNKEKSGPTLSGDVAERVYVAPGEYDEFYYFISGGFSGQMSVYGIPSGRLFRVIPVFSVDPEKGWGYTEETKPMLNTSMALCHGMMLTIRSFHRQTECLTADGYLLTEIIHRELQGSILQHSEQLK